MSQQTTSLTETPVNKMLIMMAIPISLGMTSTFLFQIVDTYFVGQLGSNELAALAFSSMIYFLFISIFLGFSIGVSSVVAKAVGAGDPAKAKRLVSMAMLLVLVVSVSASLIARNYIDATFTFLGASPEVLPLIQSYMEIMYLGFPFVMLGIVGSGAARATGAIRLTEIMFGVAGIINLLLDYLLIFGIGPFPEMGLAGAALATAISFTFIFVSIIGIMWQNNLLGGLGKLGRMVSELTETMKLSIPTIFTQILVPVTSILITFLLAGYGSETVAAYGVASRIETLALVGIFAVSTALTPFIAQNFGAGLHDRIDLAVVFAGKVSIYLGAVLFIGLALSGPYIARIFSEDLQVIAFTSLYFKFVAISYGFFGIMNVTAAIFNGMQLSLMSLKLMMVKTFILTIPLLILASFIHVYAILTALAVGNILSGIYAGFLMRKSERIWDRPIANANPLVDMLRGLKRVVGGEKRT